MSIFHTGDPQIGETLDFGTEAVRTIEIPSGYTVPFYLRFNDGSLSLIDSLPARVVRRCSSLQVIEDTTPPPVITGIAADTPNITTSNVPFTWAQYVDPGDLGQLIFILDTAGTSTPADVVQGQAIPAVVTVDVAGATAAAPSAAFVGTFTPGTFKIRGFARDTSGNDSEYSSAVNAVVPSPIPPAPTAVILDSTTPMSPTHNRIGYTVPALNHDRLELHRGTAPGFTLSASTLIANIGKATSTGAKIADDIAAPSGQLVYYVIRAVNNAFAQHSDSNELSCQTQAPAGAADPYYEDTFGATRQDGSSTEFKWGNNGTGTYPTGGVQFSSEMKRTGSHSLNFRTFRWPPCTGHVGANGPVNDYGNQGGNQYFRLSTTPLARVWMEMYLYIPDGTETIRTLSNCSVVSGSNVLTVPGGGLIGSNLQGTDDERKAVIPMGPGGAPVTVRIKVTSSTTADMFEPTLESGSLIVNVDTPVPANASITASGLSVPLKLWRYYHRVRKNFVDGVSCGGYSIVTNCKFLALYQEVYSQPSVIMERRAAYDPPTFANHVGDSVMYADWIPPAGTGPNKPKVISTGSTPVITDVERGRWNLFQYEVALPTDDTSTDGRNRLLINGVTVMEKYNITSFYNLARGAYLRKGYMHGVTNPGNNERLDMYVDDIKWWRQDPGW